MRTSLLWLIVGGIIGVVLILLGSNYVERNYTFQGALIDPPVAASDFELIDQYGRSFRLRDQLGKVSLLFFGYSNCPDVCPVTLSEYKQVKSGLGDQAGEVNFIFITVDPERDTVERLNTYLSNFDAEFYGLTGSREQLEQVWQRYGVYQAKQDLGSAAGYLVDHTARTYIIDQEGNWLLTYPFEMDPDAILEDVKHLIKEG